MDRKKIEELIALMEKKHLSKIQLKEKDFEITLERELGSVVTHVSSPTTLVEKQRTSPSEVDTNKYIQSPMVGIFYAAPAPDHPPFVKKGDHVTKDTVVCIIEAMKVMNEVKAGQEGKVVEILVDNAHPVEFGTHLIRIE
ncbi:MAG: acetyl-CoA carboxylase biotin carboxyl carrier protein [Parachlamydiales bacterium]|nr:acetyl-CoA carboxylase biotin carboxyl carrier protein [Parachlamydiales bacterium]